MSGEAIPKFHETTTVRQGKKVKAFSRTFKLEKVNGREWLRDSKSTEARKIKVPATVQVKTTNRAAVGQLAQRAAGRLFSVYCHHSNKKVGCSASVEIREITQCVPNDRQKTYKYNASRLLIKEEERGPRGQKFMNKLSSHRARSRSHGSSVGGAKKNRSLKKKQTRK